MSNFKDNACPRCGGETECDEADVGIGVMYGPRGCPSCFWTEAADGWSVPRLTAEQLIEAARKREADIADIYGLVATAAKARAEE